MAANSDPNNNASQLLMPEIGADGLARENPVIAYTEKVIEEEQLQLRKYIAENYSKIRDVERELSNLTMEMKLTAGPKKAALEHMRKKIEISTEKIRVAKLKEEQAKKAWEAAVKAVQEEEDTKQKLCDDLNNLVKESSKAQLTRLEELKRRLEALNPSRPSIHVSSDGNQSPAHASISQDSSAVPSTSQLASGTARNVSNEDNASTLPAKGQNDQASSIDGDGRGKKKNTIHGKVRGIGAVPKGRGPAAPGWTGAGFDVDGRS